MGLDFPIFGLTLGSFFLSENEKLDREMSGMERVENIKQFVYPLDPIRFRFTFFSSTESPFSTFWPSHSATQSPNKPLSLTPSIHPLQMKGTGTSVEIHMKVEPLVSSAQVTVDPPQYDH